MIEVKLYWWTYDNQGKEAKKHPAVETIFVNGFAFLSDIKSAITKKYPLHEIVSIRFATNQNIEVDPYAC